MVAATNQPADRLCTACFTGIYPIPLPDVDRLGKHVLETLPGLGSAPAGGADPEAPDTLVDVEGVQATASAGAADALSRP